MARPDDDEPRRVVSHDIGSPLDDLPVVELEARIALLKAEISRLEQAIHAKQSAKNAANAFFKT